MYMYLERSLGSPLGFDPSKFCSHSDPWASKFGSHSDPSRWPLLVFMYCIAAGRSLDWIGEAAGQYRHSLHFKGRSDEHKVAVLYYNTILSFVLIYFSSFYKICSLFWLRSGMYCFFEWLQIRTHTTTHSTHPRACS